MTLNIIPALIKREFETPLPVGRKYDHNYDNLLSLVKYFLNEINRKDELELAFKNFKIENLESEYKENQIRGIMANTKENDETPIIISKINNIVKDTEISNILIGLRKSRQDLRDSLRTIKEQSLTISQTIESGDYNIKAKCCPTISRLIRKYVM